MPPTRAALVVVMSGSPDHGEITLKPMPAPKASRSRVNAAATKPPATMAGQETAGTAGVSASTMTVSTIAAPRVCPTTSSCARGSERKAAHHRPAYGIVPHGIVRADGAGYATRGACARWQLATQERPVKYLTLVAVAA